MKYSTAILFAILVVPAVPSKGMAACSVTNTFHNGDPADALLVNQNFDDLKTCAAPVASPSFTGNVGIGTTATYALDVEAGPTPGATYARFDTTTTSSTGAGFRFSNFGLTMGWFGIGGFAANGLGLTDVGLTSRGSLALDTNGGHTTPAFFMNSTGSVGIGTASPGQRLDVAGVIRQSNCTTAGTLSTNASGDTICTSDARLKNILGDYVNGLDTIMLIRPQRFTYKPTATNPVETFVHAGFIAQQVKPAIPQAVAVQHDGFYSLDTTAILAASVNAIKELKAINDHQAAEISALRSQQSLALEKMGAQIRQLQHKLTIQTAAN